MATKLISFINCLDNRSRNLKQATVARLLHDGVIDYVVIGTPYGHIHTRAGDIRTWKSYSGARKFAKTYIPL